MKNNTLTYRVGQLERKVERLEGKIDKLRTNDIPDINSNTLSLKTRINVLTAVNVTAIVLGILAAKFIP